MTHMDEPSGGGRPAPPRPALSRPIAGARHRGAGTVAAGVAQQIDENLKRLYRHQVAQDLPPELQALVARLRDTADAGPGCEDPDGSPGSGEGRA